MGLVYGLYINISFIILEINIIFTGNSLNSIIELVFIEIF